MAFSKKVFLQEITSSSRRKVVPIMSAPGCEMLGIPAVEAFRNGKLQYECIKALNERFPADLAVTFMDLSVEAEAFGATVKFSEHEAPSIPDALLQSEADVPALPVPEIGAGRTGEVIHCLECCVKNLSVPVLGGMIGPFSLAGRLAGMSTMMMMAAAEEPEADILLEKCTAFLTNYAVALKNTGAAGVVVAEPAAGLLSPDMCGNYAAKYLKEIFAAVEDENFLTVLHNCGNTREQVEELLSCNADILHVGNAIDIRDILERVNGRIPVAGNLDPVDVFLQSTPEEVYQKTMDLLQATNPWPNYILSSGCDLPPAVPLKNVDAFFKAAADYNNSK